MNHVPRCDFTERLRTPLFEPQATDNLARYFAVDSGEGGAPLFTGAMFERLCGGGDSPAAANIITASDLIAVQMLSVTIPASAALALLEGDIGKRLSELLAEIPVGLDMAKADVGLLEPGSPADQAWNQLRELRGVDWVTANKLLARKRPRLLPVYDRVVRCVVGHPASFWLSLHHALTANDLELHEHLLSLGRSAGIPETISALRICDVVLWMRHADSHEEKACPGVLSCPYLPE